MFRSFVELAISKSANGRERLALNPVLEAANALDEDERTFGERINANKALRGEGPTKLSRRKRADVESYSTDARELEDQQLREFAAFERGSAIVACLATALGTDIKFWQASYKHAHPSDVSIVQAFVARKAALHQAMKNYLSEFPDMSGQADR